MLGTDFERVLPPTRRRREQSRLDGNIVQSRVLTTGILLILFGITWNAFGSDTFNAVCRFWKQSFENWDIAPQSSGASHAVISRFDGVIHAVTLWAVVLLAGVLLTTLVQTRGWFAPRFALPRWSRVSPAGNVSRTFKSIGPRLVNAFVSVTLCGTMGWIEWMLFSSNPSETTVASSRGFARAWSTGIESLTVQVGAVFIAVGLLDFHLRYRRQEAQLRMTPAEFAEEQRASRRTAS